MRELLQNKKIIIGIIIGLVSIILFTIIVIIITKNSRKVKITEISLPDTVPATESNNTAQENTTTGNDNNTVIEEEEDEIAFSGEEFYLETAEEFVAALTNENKMIN